MRASLKWIKELLPTLRSTPRAISKRLTAAGLEVDEVVNEGQGLESVVVAEVCSLVPHPEAERLQVAELDDDRGRHTVVCGAANIEVGQKVAFAPEGSVLPGGMKIEARPVRGVMSRGMVCSEAELGLDDQSAGILVLPSRARPGRTLVDALGLKDVIFELSVTPNRPDVLSHFGLARELAALLRLQLPRVTGRIRESHVESSSLVSVEVKNEARCPQYMARVIGGVRVGPSPAWVRRRLRAVGLRSISNVVDATNLALLELGHPLHAFDLEKLGGARIVVRSAAPGERITLIDGQDLALFEDDLVIADDRRAVALAGVMGGGTSEVSASTTEVLLESAYFEPRGVRRTSKRHGLHTEASHRFERGVDPGMVKTALDRCARLIVELSGGRVAKGHFSQGEGVRAPAPIAIRPKRASRVLGRTVERKEVRDALKALGLSPVRKTSGGSGRGRGAKTEPGSMLFRVPSWRVDLLREEDLIEEVGRLSGYDTILPCMPPTSTAVWTEGPAPDRARLLRNLLVGQGFQECISLAFHGEADATSFGLDPARGVRLANPLGEERRLLRMSMFPALLKAVQLNQDQLPSRTDLRFFELGKIFSWAVPAQKMPVETEMLALVMRGRRQPGGWAADGSLLDMFDLKGVLESLSAGVHLDPVKWQGEEASWLHPRARGALMHQGRAVGVFGEAHPDLLERFQIEGPPVFMASLDVCALTACVGTRPRFSALPRLPPAQRDLSFVLSRDVSAFEVMRVVREAGEPTFLEDAELFDVYEGEGIEASDRSLAVALTFRAKDRTLTDAEVEQAEQAIVSALAAQVGAKIRN